MNKQTEAMKLALEALEESKTNNDTMEFHDRKNKAITALQALAEQPRLLSAAPCDQCGYNGSGYYQPKTHPCASKHHKALTEQTTEDDADATIIQYHEATIKRLEARITELEQLAQQEPVAERFEKMHANGDVWITTIAAAAIARNLSSQPAQQQEPVYFCDYGYEGWGKVDAAMAAANIADGMTVEAYYTSPPAQRKPLTDSEIIEMRKMLKPAAGQLFNSLQFARAIEAAHGITGEQA